MRHLRRASRATMRLQTRPKPRVQEGHTEQSRCPLPVPGHRDARREHGGQGSLLWNAGQRGLASRRGRKRRSPVSLENEFENMTTRRTTAAENVAINMLADDPDLTLEEAFDLVLESNVELWDSVTRTMVRPEDVARELSKLGSSGSGVSHCPPGLRVYHATDLSTARSLVRRGFIPETKPRPRHAKMEYAP